MAFVPPEDSENILAELLAENADLHARLAELQGLYEKVYKLDQLKSMFFVTINHELRTLLSLILGPAELLLQQTSLIQDMRQALEMVTRNALLLLKLVNDLLEISHLELGQLKLHYATHDLSQLVSLVTANFKAMAEKRQITYCVQVPAVLWVEVDPARIERILLKLLSNAFKFTEKGEVSLQVLWQGSTLVIQVSDTGIGIPAHMHEIIFETFRQVDSSSIHYRTLSQH